MKKLLGLLLFLAAPLFGATDYYTDPAGSGTACTTGSPCTNLTASGKALVGGDRVLLKNGHYTGSSGMLNFSGVNGTAATCNWHTGTLTGCIEVAAVNDGLAEVDGGNTLNPLILGNNPNSPTTDYFYIHGINFHSSIGSVIVVKSNHNKLSRIVAWDATFTGNNHVVSIHGPGTNSTVGGYDNLIEDVAAFGTGRKMYESFQSNGNTFRRIWARWEGNLASGPKRDIQWNYHSHNTVIDNAYFRWDSRCMISPYFVRMDDGTDAQLSPGLVTGCPTDPAKGLVSCSGGVKQAAPDCRCQYPGTVLVNELDGNAGDTEVDSATPNGGNTVSGVLNIVKSDDLYDCITSASTKHGFIENTGYGGQTLKDIFVYVDSTVRDRISGLSCPGFKLSSLSTSTVSTLTNATSIAPGSAGDSISATRWTTTNKITGTTLANTTSAGGGACALAKTGAETAYAGSCGAKIRYRYVDGVLGSTPLWPWPMNQRIIDALTTASTDGHNHQIEDPDGVRIGLLGFSADETPDPTVTNTPVSTNTPTRTSTTTRTPTVTPTPGGVCHGPHWHTYDKLPPVYHNHGYKCGADGIHVESHIHFVVPTPVP